MVYENACRGALGFNGSWYCTFNMDYRILSQLMEGKKMKLETIEITVNVDTDKFDLQSVADYFQKVLDTLEEVGTIETWGIIA